jgi:hypothetical protein
MTASNVAKLVHRPDGDLAWHLGERVVARICASDGGWRVSWQVPGGEQRLRDLFPSLHAACLAAEKRWPAKTHYGWVESAQGGFFRLWGRSRIHVRQTDQGWYAVRDGKILHKAEQVIWFATESEAIAAVERDLYTPFDADPFRNTSDRYIWATINHRAA